MKDPLSDGRVFPEEMQESKPKKKENIHVHPGITWIWTVFVVIILAIIIWFGYRYSKTKIDSSSVEFTYEEQVTILDTFQNSQPELTKEERDEKIRLLFSNQ